MISRSDWIMAGFVIAQTASSFVLFYKSGCWKMEVNLTPFIFGYWIILGLLDCYIYNWLLEVEYGE